jgi:hypothetical protein
VQAHGHAELYLPAEVRVGEAPVLGTGKVDHAGARRRLETGEAA